MDGRQLQVVVGAQNPSRPLPVTHAFLPTSSLAEIRIDTDPRYLTILDRPPTTHGYDLSNPGRSDNTHPH